MVDYNDRCEIERLAIFGTTVRIVENILSPRPVNIWHVPGALRRVITAVLAIFKHGYKSEQLESRSNVEVWNFVFGLRVLSPNLWPTLGLKHHETNQQKFTFWLETSLKNHRFREQVKTLIEEEERIQSFYYEWAFLRIFKFSKAFLIVLNALEHNSQDILAMIDPNLMVSCNKHLRKSSDNSSFNSTAEEQISSTKEINIAKDVPLPPRGKSPLDFESSTRELIIEHEEVDNSYFNTSSYKVSPSCLEVDYACNILSDVERHSATLRGISVSPEIKSSSTNVSVPSENDVNGLRKHKFRRKHSNPIICIENKRDLMFTSTSSCVSPNLLSSEISSSPANSELIDRHFNASNGQTCSNFVQPSPFLLKYLSSKPNAVDNLRKRITLYSADSDDPSAPINLESSSTSFHNPQRRTEINENKKSISQTKRPPVIKHVRSHSDGAKILLKVAPLQNLIPVSISKNAMSSSSMRSVDVPPSFMDDGGHSIVPEADGFFPHPQPGQNLLEFLCSPDFSKSNAQLDKENAHFSVAEAVLAAIEQMNFDTNCQRKDSRPKQHRRALDESEDDILQYKKNRRRTKLRSRASVLKNTSDDEPATTDYSMLESPEMSEDSDSSFSESTTNDESGAMMSQYTSDELSASCQTDPSSAENIAISILVHYNTKLLPQASELQWLVTEQDAPQKLLPMPNSVAVSPDDADQSHFMPLLRGTLDWAPPRPQLILTLHTNMKRTDQLRTQKWRCAGCGLKVSEKLSRYFRLCHYLGRYFCTVCHSNREATIPARVLHKWDFKKYVVSNFALELLCRMKSDPLFHLGTLNPKLYRLSRDLHQVHIYRLQLYHARIYVDVCAKATKEKLLLDDVPLHWSKEPHIYSLEDLLTVRDGHLVNKINQLASMCISHISKCKVCLGQGFICEICRQGSPIFPFQLDAVTRCTKCGECFHFVCFSPIRCCPRCVRREKRADDNRASTIKLEV